MIARIDIVIESASANLFKSGQDQDWLNQDVIIILNIQYCCICQNQDWSY